MKSECCPLCGSNHFKVLGKPRVGEKLIAFEEVQQINIIRCQDCGFYFTDPKLDMSDDILSYLYDESYFTPMTSLWEKQRGLDRRRRLDKLEEISNSSIKRFLDIGCGEGLILRDAISRGWETYGQDISNNLQIDHKDGSFEFHLGELEKGNFPDNHFSALYMDSVLEHVEYPFEMLKEMLRILKPGGVVHVGVPNEDSLFNVIKHIIFKIQGKGLSEKIEPLRPPYHINGFSPKSIRSVSTRAGFVIDDLNQLSGIHEPIKFRLNERAFWISLFMLTVNVAGIIFKKGIYIDVFAHKPKK